MSKLPYWQQRREMKLKGKPTAKEEKEEKAKKGEFFRDAIAKAPAKCPNCGKSLSATIAINPAAIVAHIIPKSKKQGAPSVATHALNKVILCGDCHTNYDQQGCSFVAKMKPAVVELMRERVGLMWEEIPENERKRVPECLRPE